MSGGYRPDQKPPTIDLWK